VRAIGSICVTSTPAVISAAEESLDVTRVAQESIIVPATNPRILIDYILVTYS